MPIYTPLENLGDGYNKARWRSRDSCYTMMNSGSKHIYMKVICRASCRLKHRQSNRCVDSAARLLVLLDQGCANLL